MSDRIGPNPEFTILYDGECPFCVRELAWLKRRDRGHRLNAVDIAAPDFSPRTVGLNVSRKELMARIHGLDAEGKLVTGMAVFRNAYRVAGIGWIMAPTGWPILRPIFDVLYRGFARIRVPLGRLLGRRCDDGTCLR